MEYILIDFGSSTVKPYHFNNNVLTPLTPKSVHFKSIDILAEGVDEIVKSIMTLQSKYPNATVKTYATSVFRKLDPKSMKFLVDSVFDKTNVKLNIISSNLESLYLEKALIGKFAYDESLMLLNIGGGSTEIIVVKPNEEHEKYWLEIGVGSILKEFPTINDELSKIDKDTVVHWVANALPNKHPTCNIAFYSGGELEYMERCEYNLTKNVLFEDIDHPMTIESKYFFKRNDEIFNNISIQDLKSRMPENPDWMLGARACSALAESIFRKFNIATIVPSNTNLIHGVIKHEQL